MSILSCFVGTQDPKIASELSLRLPHLGIRMAEHSRRALAYAERLEQVTPQLLMLHFHCGQMHFGVHP